MKKKTSTLRQTQKEIKGTLIEGLLCKKAKQKLDAKSWSSEYHHFFKKT